MEKTEILAVLREMKVDFESVVLLKDCEAGFCRWLNWSSYWSFKTQILSELQADLVRRRNFFWYKPYFDTYNTKVSIQPRIDHLNRTITRLENELKNEE